MVIHPEVVQLNGIVSVKLTAQFNGANTDVTDKQRIQAYGDPKVNLAGLMTDPSNTEFQFSFSATEKWAGITTEMQNYTARFMSSIPPRAPNGYPGNPGWPRNGWQNNCNEPEHYGLGLGPLDCITTNPVEAATVYAAIIQSRCSAAMTTLRALTPPQLTSLNDATI